MELENIVSEKGLQLQFEEKKRDIHVIADKDKVRQVLINIINNSYKFTEKGYIKLTLDKVENNAIILVEDSGIGIKKDKIAYLFNKFYTANDYGNATNGAGLGLNIVKNIIDMHKGKIIIESEVNQGTKTRIELPIK